MQEQHFGYSEAATHFKLNECKNNWVHGWSLVSSASGLHLSTSHEIVYAQVSFQARVFERTSLSACSLIAAWVFVCVCGCIRIDHWAACPGVSLPVPQRVVRKWGWKEQIQAGRRMVDGGWRCRVQVKRRNKGGGEGAGQNPWVRCCQDNSRQPYLLRRTKQNYSREQKSANTCLGGSSWGTEREKEGKGEGGMVQCTKMLASTDEVSISVCVRESECVCLQACVNLFAACMQICVDASALSKRVRRACVCTRLSVCVQLESAWLCPQPSLQLWMGFICILNRISHCCSTAVTRHR